MSFSRPVQICIITTMILIGIILGRQGWEINASIILVPLVAIAFIKPNFLVYSLAIIGFSAGIWQGNNSMSDRQQLSQLVGKTVNITATIANDPAINNKGIMSFEIQNIKANGTEIPGTLQVYTYPLRVHRGFDLQLTGKVKPGYGKYIAQLVYPKTTVISSDQSELEQIRQRFFAGMRTALSEPASSLGLGLLVGIRALIPKPLQNELALVGLSHIVAVSGYNLTIIVRAVDRLLAKFGRGIALLVALWLIAGFLAVTGASAPIVRAAVVSVLMLLATYYGRQFNALVLILVVASGTALVKPDYLTDIGWLLSFLAFYGILILAPAIWQRFGEPKSILIKLLIESVCAQILTIPLILYFFGQLSIIAPITNVIILPMIPLIMMLCFVAGLAGMFLPAFCGWLAWPAQLILNFVLDIIGSFAALPWAGTTIYFDAQTMMISYLIIILATLGLKRSIPKESLKSRDSLGDLSLTNRLT